MGTERNGKMVVRNGNGKMDGKMERKDERKDDGKKYHKTHGTER